MKYFNSMFILLFTCLFSCSDAHNYDVYVQNDSSAQIEIAYKSLKDRSGIVENQIVLPAGSRKQIISTVNLSSAERSIKPVRGHCYLVAEYVTAILDGKEGSLKWCDPEIDFVIEDFGEGRFTMVFKDEHFE